MQPVPNTLQAEAIVRYAVRESQLEHRSLGPCPQHYLYTKPLMDFLVEIGAATAAQIEEWTNDEADRIDRTEKGGE